MTAHAFCMGGSHSVEMEDAGVVPEGWSLIRCSVIPAPLNEKGEWMPGMWYRDESSDSSILICPEHIGVLGESDTFVPDIQERKRSAKWTDYFNDYEFPFHEMFGRGLDPAPPI